MKNKKIIKYFLTSKLINDSEWEEYLILKLENKLLKENRNKTIEYIKRQIYYLEQQKRMLLNSGKITPQNGGILAELKYEIRKNQDLLEMLKGDQNEQ